MPTLAEALEQAARAREPHPRHWPAPGDLARALDPSTRTSRPLEIIDRELVKLADHQVPADALAIFMAPQEGKSVKCSRWFPLWLLAHDPALRIAIISYEQEMAVRWGRQILRDLRHADRAILDVRVMPDSSAAGRWETPEGGGIYCAGVGGALTGRPVDCLRGDTEILTQTGYVKLRDIHRAARKPHVLSFNHTTGQSEWKPVITTRAIPGRSVTEIRTTAGRTIHCTPDHRIYTDRGYVPAADLRPGERLLTANDGPRPVRPLRDRVQQSPVHDLAGETGNTAALQPRMPVRRRRGFPDLRPVWQDLHKTPLRDGQGAGRRLHRLLLLTTLLSRGRRGYVRYPADLPHLRRDPAKPRSPLLFTSMQAAGSAGHRLLLAMRDRIRDGTWRGPEENPQGADGQALLTSMHGGVAVSQQPGRNLPAVWRVVQRQGPQVLFTGLPGNGPATETSQAVPAVRCSVRAEEQPHDLLRSGLRQRGPLAADDRRGELAFQGRHQLRRMVPADASADPGTGRQSLPGLPESGPACSPHQPPAAGQLAGEPDPALRDLPCGPPQVQGDTVSMVRELRGVRDTVYDLQVEGNRNFFAGQVLVHNCLIIDDPVKGREEAESAVYRERAWDWWENVAIPRLAPGGITALIQTRWHQDDLSGRIMSRPSPLRWRVLSMPAISEGPGDPLGRPAGEEFPSVRGRPPGYFHQLHANLSPYVFSSIYQQKPAAAEGNFFRRVSFRYWRPATGQPDPAAVLARAAMAGAWISLDGRTVDLADPGVWRFATCDLAASEKTSADWTVISVWAITREADLVLLDRARSHAEMADHFALAKPLRARWRFDVLYVPREYWSKTLITDARAAGVPVAEVTTDADKVTRAIPAAGRLHAGKVWWPHADVAPWLDEWEDEIATFPRATHDDQVDTLSAAARIAAAHWVAPAPPGRPAPPDSDLAAIAAAYAAASGNGHHTPDVMTMPLG